MPQDFMERELFSIGQESITVTSLLLVAAVLVGSYLLSVIVQRIMKRLMSKMTDAPPGLTASTQRLAHYLVMTIGIVVVLDVIGFDMKTLFAAGALLAIALGFAMQNIVQNFVSGVILLTERSIKPGDVLEVEGTVVRVSKMGIRSAIAKTREETDVIIPNSTLVQSTVKNFTLRSEVFRIRATVGIAYSTDVGLAIQILQEAASGVEWRHPGHEPVVFLDDFNDSSISLEVSVWIDDPWGSRVHYSELRMLIWRTLKANDITIAFPQMDVHVNRLSETGQVTDSG